MTIQTAGVPVTDGVCEYCLRETAVYAFILWTCKHCMEEDGAS